ncbi:stress protein [Alkalicoccobacillus plakortidis]|uniref:Stress protein n=1 Tax=Alkalicoccobacillus plakortidis TaxID=444060 RepID=A0ABT0XMY0_9BACI|nr:stress protein [Alkalicoccobacillus plakortidis]MCM2677256.1 stress protein [Alkalicoccobacillus plakortidis]
MKKTRSKVMSTVAGAAILGMTIAIPSYGAHGNVAKAEEPAVQELSDEEKGQALEQQAQAKAPNVDITIDPVAIFDSISETIKTADNRGGFVKAARETVSFHTDYSLNVMVLNLSNDYDESSYSGVHYFDTFTYDGAVYGVWAFEEGTFVNNGDGGYDNWAFYGWFDRDGGTVEFHLP